jgi:hypothetical protein
VDLSRVPFQEKQEYLNSLLPMLASHRRSTGLPHRIVIDEAHYFLHEPYVFQLLDLDLGAYTLVTYRPSDLHPDLRKAIDVVVATRMIDSQSLDAILTMRGESSANADVKKVIESLTINEATILPGPVTGGKPMPFKLLPRLTPHVRHRVKYFDVSVGEGQGFVFTSNGTPVAPPVRTLKEFVSALASLPPEVLDGHAKRGTSRAGFWTYSAIIRSHREFVRWRSSIGWVTYATSDIHLQLLYGNAMTYLRISTCPVID